MFVIAQIEKILISQEFKQMVEDVTVNGSKLNKRIQLKRREIGQQKFYVAINFTEIIEKLQDTISQIKQVAAHSPSS